MSTYTVFIPRVFSNISSTRISDVFHNLDIGDVKKVDLVARTGRNGERYNMAFVHFTGFYDTEASKSFQRDVENPENKAKVVYDDPWFWIVLPFEKKETPVLNINSPTFTSQVHAQPYPKAQMVPIWTMTPQGPMWQWGYQPMMPMDPHTIYGNREHKPRRHPKKRINPPTQEDGEIKI
jgi:hypothetical protein